MEFQLLKVPANTDEDEANFVTITTSKDQLYNNKDEHKSCPLICKNNNRKMIECLLNLPEYQYNNNLLTMINIDNHQQADGYLMQSVQVDTVHFPVKIINKTPIICY